MPNRARPHPQRAHPFAILASNEGLLASNLKALMKRMCSLMGFVLRWIVTAVAVAAAVWLVPGVEVSSATESWVGVAAFALFLALLNMSIKPILQFLSLPITCLTLGIFYLVVNTFMLYLASWLATGLFDTGLVISSFGSAFVASIVISVVSAILNSIVGADD